MSLSGSPPPARRHLPVRGDGTLGPLRPLRGHLPLRGGGLRRLATMPQAPPLEGGSEPIDAQTDSWPGTRHQHGSESPERERLRERRCPPPSGGGGREAVGGGPAEETLAPRLPARPWLAGPGGTQARPEPQERERRTPHHGEPAAEASRGRQECGSGRGVQDVADVAIALGHGRLGLLHHLGDAFVAATPGLHRLVQL